VHDGSIANAIFLIFVGASALATLALYARQAMIVAYIAVGMLFGPSGLGFVNDVVWLNGIAEIGIMFLLYLLGLNLAPGQLARMFREALWVTVASSLALGLIGFAIARAGGWTTGAALVAGAVLMFSSTIIGVKLLPTTTLHQQRMGQVMISVLLLQDLIAIVIVLLIEGAGGESSPVGGIARQLGALVAVGALAAAAERLAIEKLIARFDRIQEYLFLLVIAWCLGIAEFGAWLGLPREIGAFVAGVALASSPVAQFIAESLKPLRDFFLVLFFFSLGASFNLSSVAEAALTGGLLALSCLVIKPLVFRMLLTTAGEKASMSFEIGVRLGQISEFSLFVVVVALKAGVIGQIHADTLKMATLLTFVASSYWVVMRYPTPMAIADNLRRD
jgi:Kef-type K+ transport system membrane component KefB